MLLSASCCCCLPGPGLSPYLQFFPVAATPAEDPSDSEYSVGEDLEEQERARSRRGRGRPRTRPRSEELDSSEESDPEYMDSRA